MAEDTPQILRPVAMHDRYGPFLRSFFARYFNPIHFPPEAAERIRDLAGEGTIVYLSRSANLLHFLYLNHVCLRHDLPLARFVNGVDPVLVQPLGLLFERMHVLGSETQADLDEEDDQLPLQQLATVVEAGEASLLFLDRPSTLTSPKGGVQPFDQKDGDREEGDGLLETLLRVQSRIARPLFIIPHLTIMGLHPERASKALTDAIFGMPESPGFLRTLFRLMRHYRHAFVKVAEPVDLRAFVQERSNQPAAEAAAELHAVLEQRLSLEVFDVTGPRIKPPAQFKQEVIEDPKVSRVIEELSEGDPGRAAVLYKKAQDMIDEIAAEPRIRWPMALNRVLNMFWKRMYEGIVVDDDGYERIRAAIRKSPVVLCPSHKSHVDYLILSQLCFRYAVPLPHIAAGVNLSFWPMGPIFRHSGAFFLRRSFKGDRLYPAVFRTYLRHVMREGYPIEFFIEGTRSRTGKLLNPRFGILSWLIEAYLEGTSSDIQFVPISIDYEKIVESRSYVSELSGGEKKKEDVASLVKSSKALKSKYGKIYVQVGEPVSLREMLVQRGVENRKLGAEGRRTVVQQMAHRILFEINRVSTVTPSALLAFALLTHRRRGMSQEVLFERARWVSAWIRRRGHDRFSATLDDFERSLLEAATRFARDGLITIHDTGHELVYAPVESKRLALDYYRNNLIHHFVPAAICALALASFTIEAPPRDALGQRIRALSVLFKFEFLFRSERHFEEDLHRALDDLKSEDVIREENEFVVKVADQQERRGLFQAVLEHYLEAYWLTARGLHALRKGPMPEKEFLARTLTTGDRLFVQGELQLVESLNREAFKNALKTFADRDVLTSTPQEGRKGPLLELEPPYRKPARLDELADELAVFLPGRG